MLDKFISIGFTKKTYGSKGQVKMVIEEPYVDDVFNCDFIFINYMGKPLPFFIESIEEMGDLLLKVEDIDSPETAKKIVAKELLLREKDISEKINTKEESHLFFKALINYVIVDEEKGRIGSIKEIQELPQQELAVVNYEGTELLIPLHPSLIKDINEKDLTVIMHLPEGLLDMS
ncbi:MAG: ribosome maturation factor RimM [Bacteroidota bacterium]